MVPVDDAGRNPYRSQKSIELEPKSMLTFDLAF